MSYFNLSHLVLLVGFAAMLALLRSIWASLRLTLDEQRRHLESSFWGGLSSLLVALFFAVGFQVRDLAALGSVNDWLNFVTYSFVFVGGFELGQAATLWRQRRTAAHQAKGSSATAG